MNGILKLSLVSPLWLGLAVAQAAQEPPDSALVGRSVKAIGYQVGGGSTRVDLKSTELMPRAGGEARIEAKSGITNIEVDVKAMEPGGNLSTEFLTYVVWVVSPDGRASNVGEIVTNNSGNGKLKATTQLQTFSLIVTAEPYFAVRQPSELVVLENDIRKDTKGKIFIIRRT
jgi:hypothetical protein